MPVWSASQTSVLVATNDAFDLILLKNNVLLMQEVLRRTERKSLSYQALRVCCGAGKILASLRRFASLSDMTHGS